MGESSVKDILHRDKKDALKIRAMDLSHREMGILSDIQKDKKDNAIYHFTRPNPPQDELLDAWKDRHLQVFTFTGGNRSGKTTIGVIIAFCTMFGFYPWNNERLKFIHKKPRKVRLIGQDWEKHIMAVVIPTMKEWWPKNRPVTIRKNNVGAESLWTDDETGSTLEIMSNKQESDLHEGWNGDLIYYDEPPKRNIRIANARGLVDRQGRELFCMTLLKEAWVDKDIIKKKTEAGIPDTSVFNVHTTIYDNIGYGLTEEGVAAFANKLEDDEKDARLKGIPSYMSGLIYSDYSKRKHTKPRFQVPLDWPVDIAIDVHPREKQAVLFIATAPDNRKYIVEEIWDNGDGTWLGEQVVRVILSEHFRVGQIIIDPLSKGDKNNPNTVYDKVQDVLLSYGFPLKVATKDLMAGIRTTKNWLKAPNGDPALFIFEDLIRTIYEIEGYMWEEDKQKPLDRDDHMMENLYRLLLLDTKYTEPIDEDDERDRLHDKRNSVTGY